MNDSAEPSKPSDSSPARGSRAQVFRGFWMTTAILLGLIGAAALVRPTPRAQEVGLLLFALLFPLTFVTLVLTCFPRPRSFALGMLLSCGALLLFSFGLCSIKGW